MDGFTDTTEQCKAVDVKHACGRSAGGPRRARARDLHLCTGHATPVGGDDGAARLGEAEERRVCLECVDGRAREARGKVVRRVAHLRPHVGAAVWGIFGTEREELGQRVCLPA
ncbi:hypothetical protein GLX27_002824 [Malassezia furfur]|uniref:Uncharacterized protein n=1 Tax=Malassezia furfur TaxID=55194 RepID=A0ABY8ERN1_MALFU|nr:hypothetical protein GLX27_002824 [Malassezia furfur]